ncbi:MAG TPA: hypothetical protein VGP73_15690 [Thermoanaerobaculia bacterium]
MAERQPVNPKRGLIILSSIALLLVVSYWLGMWLWYHDWKQGANFGSAFGAANTLFSGLALAAVIFAIFLQHGQLLAAHDSLRESVKAQERAEASLRKTMELDIILKLFETYRESRERHRDYSGPEFVWSWDAFNKKYPTSFEKQRSSEWRYISDYGGLFELCGLLLREDFIGKDVVTMLPRAKPLWDKAQGIVLGMRGEMGSGLWGNWEYFAERQRELSQSPFEGA